MVSIVYSVDGIGWLSYRKPHIAGCEPGNLHHDVVCTMHSEFSIQMGMNLIITGLNRW